MIQAKTVADDSPTGYFIDNGTEYKLQCDNNVSVHNCINTQPPILHIICIIMQTAATHRNSTDKDSLVLIWISPPAGTGAIRFRYHG